MELNPTEVRMVQLTGLAREYWDRAVAAGRISPSTDGRFINPIPPSSAYLRTRLPSVSPNCHFLDDFLFKVIYDQQQVPYGCSACFKLKIEFPNLRGLVAIQKILELTNYAYKLGVNFPDEQSQGIFTAFLYLDGLESAQAAERDIRDKVGVNAILVGMPLQFSLMRGCSHFQTTCGSPDTWRFDKSLVEVETQLKPLFHQEQGLQKTYKMRKVETMVQWIMFARQIGDDTYLEFTNNQPL